MHILVKSVQLDLALRQLSSDVLQVEEDASGLGLFARRVSRGEIIYTTCQLAVMTQTGITLSTALGGILDLLRIFS